MLLSLKSLKDAELLSATRVLVEKERAVTAEVLRFLAEIERRKLYCDLQVKDAAPGLRYGSLFEYAVKELGYSEGSASRRIQAMRLVREIPEVAAKIESGTLSLSNISQAQNFFREVKRSEPARALSLAEKKAVLEKLEDKSAREGQRVLCSLGGPTLLPRERERVISTEHVEVSFVLSENLKRKLQEARSLLGPKGAHMSLAELVDEMASFYCEHLMEHRFGKRRMREERVPKQSETGTGAKSQAQTVSPIPTPPSAVRQNPNAASPKLACSNPNVGVKPTRYIPTAIKHQVWKEAQGRCQRCGSQHCLQFDHVEPLALGGTNAIGNIQLLCQSCNLRRAIKSFGAQATRRL